MADINDYGIKVSFPGINVQDAADQELLFNSSWPTLKVANSLRLISSADLGTSDALVYSHGLGYVPLVIPFGIGTANSNVDPRINRQNLGVNDQGVYSISAGGSDGTLERLFQMFYVDIETAFTAPVINTSSAGSIVVDANYGIKATLPGKDISSTDLRDFTVHSSTRGPTVHAVAPGVIGADGTFSYTHDLNYSPMFIALFRYDPSKNLYVVINGYGGVSASGSTITINSNTASAGAKVSIIILKDPLTPSDNVINVSL